MVKFFIEKTAMYESDIAYFNYNHGLKYANDNNLELTTKYTELVSGRHFMMESEAVVAGVENEAFPEIKRVVG